MSDFAEFGKLVHYETAEAAEWLKSTSGQIQDGGWQQIAVGLEF